MNSAIRRSSLALTAFTLLFAGSIKAAGPTQAVDALISDCKTISCLRNLLRGPEGPAGPRGPKGDPGAATRQDVYAGSYRMGRLIGIDVTAQCGKSYVDRSGPNTYDEIGLMALVETSTGWVVHLCLGVPFDSPDVGVGMTEISDGPDAQFFYKTADCSGQPYAEIRGIEFSSFSYEGNQTPALGHYGGVFGKLMGKPRIAVLPAVIFGGGSRQRAFGITGASEKFQAKSFGPGGGSCFAFPTGISIDRFVPVLPNNPSITGIPNAPVTPYTLVDVQ